MKSISFTVEKNGRGYVKTSLTKRNRTAARGANMWELVIAGCLILVTAGFVCLMLFAI